MSQSTSSVWALPLLISSGVASEMGFVPDVILNPTFKGRMIVQVVLIAVGIHDDISRQLPIFPFA
jgi:hypothetical protein